MFIGGGGIPLGIDPDDEFYGIDWSKIDKPVKLTVTERVDIDNLQAFAGSEEGKKEISTFYPEEEDNDNNEDQLDNVFDGKSAREIIFMFLRKMKPFFRMTSILLVGLYLILSGPRRMKA